MEYTIHLSVNYDGLPDDWDDSTMDSTDYTDKDIVSEW